MDKDEQDIGIIYNDDSINDKTSKNKDADEWWTKVWISRLKRWRQKK